MLAAEQQKELTEYVFSRNRKNGIFTDALRTVSNVTSPQTDMDFSLTEIREGDLYFCLEERTVFVGSQKVELTTKEFDALHLLTETAEPGGCL